MKKAIISGSTGLIGSALAKYLNNKEIDVLCLGQKQLDSSEIFKIFGFTASYMPIAMKDILLLKENVNRQGWIAGDECVFYHSAWRGESKLTDGDFECQLKNAIYAADAIKVSKKIGCVKFINIGTIEETLTENWLQNQEGRRFNSTQTNYALAKLACRDICKIISYLEKINYVHTRLSVPLDFSLNKGTYISSTLKKIANNLDYVKPTNKQLFDIISLDDVVSAFHLIGLHGKNKSDYYVGTSSPCRLEDYFSYFYKIVNKVIPNNTRFDFSSYEGNDLFDNSMLKNHTSFSPKRSFEDLALSFIK